ncbi:MAG: archaeosortase/exosortase family protein [Bacteroidota bacterium]|nr:archaeosortase/exosortase family protein [Bacteroidota bacterium]
MLKSIFKNPVALFFFKAIGLYIIWYLLYDLWIHPAGKLDLLVIDNLIYVSSGILKLLGYQLIDYPYSAAIRSMGIDGAHGLWVGDACNGLTLFALFTGFIIAFPGPIKSKLWFIPLGLVSIHFINILRIVGLAVTQLYFPDSLDFNHTYTFTFLVYGWVFLLWVGWVRLAGKVQGISV